MQQPASGNEGGAKYVAVSSTMHVAAAEGSQQAAYAAHGPSIDDVSDATGSPVAQLTWQLPQKVHVPFAPAAHLNAAPVSAFNLRGVPVAGVATAAVSSAGGAVSHHLTPTWAPAAF